MTPPEEAAVREGDPILFRGRISSLCIAETLDAEKLVLERFHEVGISAVRERFFDGRMIPGIRVDHSLRP